MIKLLIELWKTNRVGCVGLLVIVVAVVLFIFVIYQIDFSGFIEFISQPITEAPLWLVAFFLFIALYLARSK